MKKFFTLLCTTLTLLSVSAQAQSVNIPDPKFKAVLLNNPNINTNGDNKIQYTEAKAYTGAINCSYELITDLTGIEAFTELTELHCTDNKLTHLDLWVNTKLTHLGCAFNELTDLDLAANTKLIYLNCGMNQLTNLDLSAINGLKVLFCNRNNLTTLDLSNNTELASLGCSDNKLTQLNLSANTKLTEMACIGNDFTNLDLSANPELTFLQCSYNKLTNLDLSANKLLNLLMCENNQLTNLDISANPEIVTLTCEQNQLTSLNIQNGNNQKIIDFYAFDNPALTCIQIDSVEYATANWSPVVDDGVQFSLDCLGTASPSLPTPNATTLTISPNPSFGTFNVTQNTNAPMQLQVINVLGKIILTQNLQPNMPAQIDISTQAKGVFFVVTSNEKGNKIAQKIMIN